MKKAIALLMGFAFLFLLSADEPPVPETKQRDWYPYDLSEYVALPDWHGIPAVFDDPDACSEEEIDEGIRQVMLSYATFDLKEGAAELYDAVHCDVFVYFGDTLLEDQTQNDYEIVLGEASLSDMDRALAEHMIGLSAGDVCSADYTYPDSSYYYGEMAGKTVRMAAEIHGVYAPDIPPCDDSFVKELPEHDFKTVADFREAIRQDILDQKAESRVYAVWRTFLAGARVLNFPDFEMRRYMEDYMAYYNDYAREYELDLDAFLQEYFNATREEFETQAREFAQDRVKNEMIFTQLSREMGTVLSEKEYRAGIQAYYEKEKVQFETLEEYVAHYGETVLRQNLIWDKSLRKMAQQAVRLEPDAA